MGNVSGCARGAVVLEVLLRYVVSGMNALPARQINPILDICPTWAHLGSSEGVQRYPAPQVGWPWSLRSCPPTLTPSSPRPCYAESNHLSHLFTDSFSPQQRFCRAVNQGWVRTSPSFSAWARLFSCSSTQRQPPALRNRPEREAPPGGSSFRVTRGGVLR